MFKQYNRKLYTKFILWIVLTISIILGVYLVYGVYAQRDALEERLFSKANALGNFISIVSPEAIHGFDITTLDNFVDQAMKDSEIFYVTILDTKRKQLTTKLPAGYNSEQNSYDAKSMLQWLESLSNIKLIHYPIAPLDIHLGEVILAVDTRPMQVLYTKNISQQIIIGMAGIALLSIIISTIFRRNVIEPINELQKGAKRVVDGDYVQPIKILSQDEFGELTVTFNQMMSEILEDRAELVESNMQLRRLSWAVEQSPASFVITDTKGIIEYVNTTFVQTTGYSRNEITGKNINILKSGETTLATYQELWDTILKGDIWKGELLNKKKNGDLYWEEVFIQGVTDDKGVISNYLGINMDISEQKKKDEQLRHTQKMDALGKLTGGVAHDFNNILGVILGYSELLQMRLKTEPDLLDYVNKIYESGERARKLTSRLLSFSRKQPISAEFTDINQLLIEEQNFLTKTLTARVNFALELCDEAWPIHVDKAGLQDAILNICINSLHAMPDGGSLTLSTFNQHLAHNEAMQLKISPGDYVMLSITDTGIGISKDTMENIFDPFFTTKGNEGTGLGLSQVYGYIQQSLGAINVYSERGYGTRVSIYLPRSRKTNDTRVSVDANKLSDLLTGNETILVVDDEPKLRELADEILCNHGYKVIVSEDAFHALKILETTAVDLILSDVIMPGLDGYQFATIVKEKYPQIKLQMASGFSDDFHIGTNNTQLYEKRLQKPFTSDQLLRRIRELLDS